MEVKSTKSCQSIEVPPYQSSRFIADYVILHAAEPVTQSPVWRDVSPDKEDQILFEERHLRYISPLGKVRFGPGSGKYT